MWSEDVFTHVLYISVIGKGVPGDLSQDAGFKRLDWPKSHINRLKTELRGCAGV